METQLELREIVNPGPRRLTVGKAPNVREMTSSPSLTALHDALEWEQARSQRRFEPARLDFAQGASRSGQASKRALDFLGACIVLLLLLPVLAICAALVVLSSPGPVFFKHRRVGLGGKPFLMWKFRTMCANPDRVLEEYLDAHPAARLEWEATHKLTNDPRVTSVGRVLRRFSLDELPQLWNVVAGEMSLIGPRPIVTAEIEKYGDVISAYYAVRPGMTGLWQVSGRSNTTYSERISLDRRYVEEWSPVLDAVIFLKTFKVLLSAEGAY